MKKRLFKSRYVYKMVRADSPTPSMSHEPDGTSPTMSAPPAIKSYDDERTIDVHGSTESVVDTEIDADGGDDTTAESRKVNHVEARAFLSQIQTNKLEATRTSSGKTYVSSSVSDKWPIWD